MARKFSNKQELQKQLITIYDNFKNKPISNRQLKKACNILNILSKINDDEITRELEYYIYNNRLKSKMFVNACRPTLKCHLKYCFNYPENYRHKQNKKIKQASKKLDDILKDDFNNQVKSDNEKSKIINLSNEMIKKENYFKLKNLK